MDRQGVAEPCRQPLAAACRAAIPTVLAHKWAQVAKASLGTMQVAAAQPHLILRLRVGAHGQQVAHGVPVTPLRGLMQHGVAIRQHHLRAAQHSSLQGMLSKQLWAAMWHARECYIIRMHVMVGLYPVVGTAANEHFRHGRPALVGGQVQG